MAFNNQVASMAIFCPQSKAPTKTYLEEIWRFMSGHKYLTAILNEFSGLSETWSFFASRRQEIASLTQGPRYLQMLADWAATGDAGSISGVMSGILSLTLLVAIQACQYFQYLELLRISHAEFLGYLRRGGGLQGYCGGLPTAVAIACSKDEVEVVKNIAIAMRIALGIGAYGELGDEHDVSGPTTIVVRLKRQGQGEELIKQFPGAYISAVTDPKTISVVGRVEVLARIQKYGEQQGLQTQAMHIRGKVHNPENVDLAQELCELSDREGSLQLPSAKNLQAPIRSNRSGKELKDCSLTHELISTILASRCEWYTLLVEAAQELHSKGSRSYTFATFGIGDCTPLSPFHKLQLQIRKVDVLSFVSSARVNTIVKLPSSRGHAFPDDAIAIVGASCRLPGANNIEELWEMLSKGDSRCVEVPTDRFDLHGSFRASQDWKFAGKKKFYGNFLDNAASFDHAFFKHNPKEAMNMDPQQRMLLELAYEAMDDSGYLRNHRRESSDPVGCFIGASFVEYLDNTNSNPPTAYTSTGTIRAFLCGRLSYYFGWEGPAEVLDTACSSSLVAINRACKAIQSGECTMALSGGVNIISGIHNFLDLSKAGFLSPTGQCKPFDAQADGYCRAEGAGLIVLKNLNQAIADGNQIHGVIPGVATNQGGLSASITVPHSVAQKKLYETVLRQAGLKAEQVSYVEAHGTGTKVGDPLEVASIREVFGSAERSNMLHIGSIKGNIGHCETAAGIAGLLKVLAMIRKRQLPPLANHSQLNPSIPPLEPDRMCVDSRCDSWKEEILAACVNSYGAAGSNCALICSEWPSHLLQNKAEPRPDLAYPIILSATSKEGLREYANTIRKFLQTVQPKPDIADIAFTLSERRKRHQYFCSFASSDIENLSRSIPSDDLQISTSTEKAKRIVLAFSGQSKQTVGMDESLYNAHPQLQKNITNCNEIVQNLGFPSIIPSIFQSEPIEDVVLLHTGIFAMQYAFAQTWLDSGLQVDAVIGHSFGELCALTVSGALSLRDGLRLIAARATLMQSKWGAERGVMLAIHSSVDVVEDVISKVKGLSADTYLEIACFNSPTSQVVVGDSSSIEATQTLLREAPQFQGVRFQKLDIAYAFHSKFTESILPDFIQTAHSLAFNQPKIPIEACTATHLDDLQPVSVCEHTRKPVYFTAAVQRLEERLGSCIWVEAGMNSPIIAMAKKAVGNPEQHTFLATCPRSGQSTNTLLSDMTISLWREGVSASYWNFGSTTKRTCKHIWLPPYRFQETKHWLPNVDHAAEMQKNRTEPTPVALEAKPPEPPAKLVTSSKSVGKGELPEFQVNIPTSRFKTIVSGHAVRQRPLCPASMYMECATMALNLLHGPIEPGSLHFEDLNFQAPLGVNLDRDVLVTLDQSKADSKSWDFVVKSKTKGDQKSRYSIHGQGIISLKAAPDLTFYQRIIADSLRELNSKQSAEKLLSSRAYSLFSRVVTYADFLKGISHITMDGKKALGKIDVPQADISSHESTAVSTCDTITIDTFIQVAGLLINSSDIPGGDEVCVATGIDQTSMSSKCDLRNCKSWTVYATYTPLGDSHGSGDIFVLDRDGALTMLIKGVRFTKLRIIQLERLLDTANSTPRIDEKAPKVAKVTKVVPPAEQDSSDSSSNVSSDDSLELQRTDSMTSCESLGESSEALDKQHEALKRLLGSYCGLSESEIANDASVRDLGVDSLAAVELAEELQNKFGKEVDAEELLDLTYDALSKLFFPNILASSARNQSKPTKPATASPNKSDSAPSSKSDMSKERSKLFQMISETSGAQISSIVDNATFESLGLDSLSAIELKSDVENTFSVEVPEEITLESTIKEFLQAINFGAGDNASMASSESADRATKGSAAAIHAEETPKLQAIIGDPITTLSDCNSMLEESARQRDFHRYWDDVAPRQDELLLAYIIEAFKQLGIDLSSIPVGQPVSRVQTASRHGKVTNRLLEILEKHDYLRREKSGHIRGQATVVPKSSKSLHEAFVQDFPTYTGEANLMALTGSVLGDCLIGKADPVGLMFKSATSRKVMEEYYCNSPMLSAFTEQMVKFVKAVVSKNNANAPIRIFEVGAGFGGTTTLLAQTLQAMGAKVEYTFTDISSSLVNGAKPKFAKYNWMKFQAFNLEKEVSQSLHGHYDIVIGTNCVHATSSKANSLRRLRQLLSPDGFAVLSEVTELVDWYDIVFGLLDGWWLAENGTVYPLQPADTWMRSFQEAGYASSSYSQSPVASLNTQRLLVGSNRKVSDNPIAAFHLKRPASHELHTIVYKTDGGVDIHADVFVPTSPPSKAIPIALMVHGGGHMTLSRKAIRPAQTEFLIANGILPISLDYRLCPEINLIEGPIADIRDAYRWARTELKTFLEPKGIKVDSTKVLMIGWSTGGHLAMTTAWTAQEIGLPPPTAILSFYSPTDFESGELDERRAEMYSGRQMSMSSIIKQLPPRPITNYDSEKVDTTGLGWVKPGDPRSELVLSLFKEGNGLPLLLNGIANWDRAVDPKHVAYISPSAQLDAGRYQTPTYVIHGDRDEIVPFAASVRFAEKLQQRGIKGGLLKVPGSRHIHDLAIRPGTKRWEEEVGPGYEFLIKALKQ